MERTGPPPAAGARRAPRRTAELALLGILLCACRATPDSAPPAAPSAPPPAAAAAAPAAVPWTVLGHSHEGRAIEAATFGSPVPGAPAVLLVATIHGDEAAGTPLLRELARRLAEGPEWLAGRRVVVLPLMNPDGLAREQRGNARGVDLNRNFPAPSWRAAPRHGEAPLSEPESRLVAELVARDGVGRVLSFHQAADLIDYDGPGAELAAALASVAPLRVARMGPRAGSLGAWAGEELGLPVITVELPRAADGASPAELWERYGPLLVEAVRQPFGEGR